MNKKTLIGLAAAMLVAVLLAVLLNHSSKPVSEGSEQTQYLVPGLREHLNNVNQIVLTGADNKPLATLKRSDSGWSVAEKSSYPADVAKVREFLFKLSDATLVEAKTSNPQRYAELGVDDVTGKDAKGTLVDIGGLEQPVRVIVGNYNGGGGGGTFVRLPNEAQSWLAKGNITVEKAAPNWLRHELTDIAATRFRAVELTSPDGKVLRAAKQSVGDANFKLADVPKGREPSSDFVANGLVSTLAGLRFDDVLPARDAEPGDKVYKARYLANDGLIVDVQAWEKDGKDYARLKAAFDETAADAQIKLDQAVAKTQFEAQQLDASLAAAKTEGAEPKPGEAAKPAAPVAAVAPLAVSDPAKDREQKLAAANKEVTDLNQLFDGWTFVIPGYKFTNLNKSMDEMLKPLESAKPDAKPDPKAAATGKKPNPMVGTAPAKPGTP